MTARPPAPQRQPFFRVQSINPLVVHAPALAPQQHVELLITRAQANGGEFPQARSQRRL